MCNSNDKDYKKREPLNFNNIKHKYYLMPRSRFDLAGVVEPGDAGHRFRLNAALEDESLAVILLPDGGLARERWRFPVHLSVS